MTSDPHEDDGDNVSADLLSEPLVQEEEEEEEEEVPTETSVDEKDDSSSQEKEKDNPDVVVVEDSLEEIEIEPQKEDLFEPSPEAVDATDYADRVDVSPHDVENGLEEESAQTILVATSKDKDTNVDEKNDTESFGTNDDSTNGTKMEADESLPAPAASEIDSSNSFSIEECLYGSSATTTTTTAHSPHQSEDDESHFDDLLVDDDWVHIREQGLWKTAPHHTVDLTLLRKLASQVGIPEEGSHRAVAWRVLLGYLPTDNRQWESTLTERRQEYKAFVQEWFTNSHDCFHGDELRWKHRMPPNRRHRASGAVVVEDGDDNDDMKRLDKNHVDTAVPVMNENTLQTPVRERLKKAGLDAGVLDSIMKNFNSLQISKASEVASSETDVDSSTVDFVDSVQLLDQIRKDVDRTFPDLKFFLDPERNLGKRRYAALERILFTWSRFNKGVNYVQGMNEIVGTIYYVLANDWNEEWAQEAEADTFWLFGILLGDMRDVFISHMDDSATGIYSRIKMMQTLLRRHDAEIIEHFDDIGIESSFFAIRWWTTLLSREFLLPDTIRLWDSMFASTHKDNFLCYVCVTMVIMIREQLLKGDFSACLRTLQAYPSIRMDELLTASRTLWLYERQITVACHKGGIGLQQALEAVRPPEAIIMAFGFRGGIIPGSQWDNKSPSRAEAIQKAREAAASSVRGAGSAVKGWLGRATKLASNLGDQVKLTRKVSSESAHSNNDDMALASYSADEDDDIYMQAIQSAESGKYSYTK